MSAPGGYYGVPLSAWRAAYRAARDGGWKHLFNVEGHPTPAGKRHASIVVCAIVLLPASWHRAHAGRLGPTWKRGRIWHEGSPAPRVRWVNHGKARL